MSLITAANLLLFAGWVVLVFACSDLAGQDERAAVILSGGESGGAMTAISYEDVRGTQGSRVVENLYAL